MGEMQLLDEMLLNVSVQDIGTEYVDMDAEVHEIEVCESEGVAAHVPEYAWDLEAYESALGELNDMCAQFEKLLLHAAEEVYELERFNDEMAELHPSDFEMDGEDKSEVEAEECEMDDVLLPAAAAKYTNECDQDAQPCLQTKGR